MKSYERLIWVGVILLVLSTAYWDRIAWNHFVDETAGRADVMSIEAKCGVAAGGALSSNEVSITCGLDDAGVEAVIASAVSNFNLAELVAQVREGSANLPAEVDEMALRLGLSREAVIDLLGRLGANEPKDALTPEKLAARITRVEPSILVNVVSTVARPERKTLHEGEVLPQTLPSKEGSDAQDTATEAARVAQPILEESTRLKVDCGVVAGKDIADNTIRLKCGPGKEDIDAILNRLITQSNVHDLVADLRQGALAQSQLLSAFEEELNLSRSSVLQLLKRIADANLPPSEAANEFAALTKKHLMLTYQLAQLDSDDPDAGHLRDLVAGAVGAGDFTIAEALLTQWSQLKQVSDNLVMVSNELAELKKESELIAEKIGDPITQQESTSRVASSTSASEKMPSEVEEQSPESEPSKVVVSGDKVALDSPSSADAGTVMRFSWRGPAAPEDLIFIVKDKVAENRYPTSDRQRHRTSKGSPAVLTTPALPGIYEIRYFSYANGKPLTRVPLEVTKAKVNFATPSTVSAGSIIEFEWHGPDAPGDLLFIAEPDMAKNNYYTSTRKLHKTSNGSPATLVVPANKGEYEIRYFSRNNATTLASKPLEVLEADVKLSAPEIVNRGAHMRFPWHGPNAPGDLIFIVKPDRPKNEYPTSKRHRTSEGQVAELVVPAEAGTYEIRYFSYANGTVLSAQALIVE